MTDLVLPNQAGAAMIDSALSEEEALRQNTALFCPPDVLSRQRLLDLMYWSIDGLVHHGQLVVNRSIEMEIGNIFTQLFEDRFPIAKMRPIVAYGWDDERSMADNNTSGFNYRDIAGKGRLSNHAFGLAIDINPWFNPYVVGGIPRPKGAIYDPQRPGTITADSYLVGLFRAKGFDWGGFWPDPDYQHFEKA